MYHQRPAGLKTKLSCRNISHCCDVNVFHLEDGYSIRNEGFEVDFCMKEKLVAPIYYSLVTSWVKNLKWCVESRNSFHDQEVFRSILMHLKY